MEKLSVVRGVVIPLDRANVDTDAIIPKQFLKSIKRSGFGPNLFDEWRYLDEGKAGQDCADRPLNADFVLNQPRYQGGSILLAQQNFGCGSSREHAVWALADFGIRVIIASSFADIFYNNTSKNGVLAISLSKDKIDALFADVYENIGYALTVNLAKEVITLPSGEVISFAIDPFKKHCLLNGLDDIALTLAHIDEINAYEKKRQRQFPWLFAGRAE